MGSGSIITCDIKNLNFILTIDDNSTILVCQKV